MALIIEDGTIVTNANSYVTTAYAVAYLDERGLTFSDVTTSYLEALAVKAKDYLEQQYFIGTKSSRDQALQWPRYYVCIDGYSYASTDLPKELLYSQVEIMYAIDQGDDPLADRTLFKEQVKVGLISVTYKEQYTHINNRRIEIFLSKITDTNQLVLDRR